MRFTLSLFKKIFEEFFTAHVYFHFILKIVLLELTPIV